MPSVGMRHSTKAFLPKSVGKDGESVTILLRSGEIAYYKSNGWRRVTPEQGVVGVSDMDIEEEPQQPPEEEPQQPPEVEMNESGEENAGGLEERRFKNVYDRKRRRSTTPTKEDRLYGAFYTRKRSRNKGLTSSGTLSRARNSDYAETAATSVSDVGSFGQGSYSDPGSWAILDVIIDDSPGSSFRFTEFFASVLKFTTGSRVALPGLAAFMCSKPIIEVFSGHGVHFKPGILSGSSISNDIRLRGFCRIFGDQASVPLFWLNCRAAPQSFVSLHTTLNLRSLYHPCHWKFLRTAMNVPPILPHGVYYNQTDRTISINSSVKKNIADFGGQGFEMDQRRISIGNASFRSFKRKRSSLRSKRPYSSLSTDLYGLQHFNAIHKLIRKNAAIKNPDALDLDMFRTIYSRHTPSATLKSNMKQTNLSKKISQNDRVVKATLVGSGQNMDSTYCSANVLVIESDRCYREEGATIMLECSVSKVWHLVVKSHGTTKFMHQAIDGMRNCSTNRFTHASIWTAENSWKLEFCDRKDLVIFKELYKECAERNIGVTSANSAIPVPGVRVVLDYDNGEYTRFLRPDSYITATGNEVTRALAKNTTIYEISQDDEEWLEMLNSVVTNVDNDTTEYLSAEKFEKIIDMFEKNAYLNRGDISDQSKFTSLCSDMGRDDIIVAVYEYWLQKRKQKRTALLSVFESLPPKRPPVEKQTVCRKKRSVKRHPSRNGRDRQRLALQDRNQLHRKSAEENLSDEEIPYDKLRRVKEEAVSNAERSAKAAISKRAKAQILMANADRAVYLAIKALRIAEIAQQAESSKAPDGLMPKPSFRIAEIAQQAESSKAPDGLIPKPSFRIAEIAQQAESSKAPDGSLPKPPE